MLLQSLLSPRYNSRPGLGEEANWYHGLQCLVPKTDLVEGEVELVAGPRSLLLPQLQTQSPGVLGMAAVSTLKEPTGKRAGGRGREKRGRMCSVEG